MANWLYMLRNINKKGEILHKDIYIYIYMYVYIEKMHKDIEGETNQLYICIIVKPLLHLIL